MCIKPIKHNNKITGIKLDFKATMVSCGILLTLLTLWTAIDFRCNYLTASAQERFVKPEAIKVFNELHKPYSERVDSMQCTNKLIIEMIKLSNPDKPWLYAQAQKNLKNVPGSFPVESDK